MYPLLEIEKLSVRFPEMDRAAVHQLNLTLTSGQTLCIVGESGSGKSITSLAILGLLPRNARQDGAIYFRPDVTKKNRELLDAHNRQRWRGLEINMVFQEPMSALNPVMTVGKQLRECLAIKWPKHQLSQLEQEWFAKVQLPEPRAIGKKYPHQLSGGQKQRVMIAMAMCNGPSLLIADEPTTALDASIQNEILLLMQQLISEQNTALIFITHDLAVAARMADHILVMRNGEMLEYGVRNQVLNHPQNPYTQALLKARPGTEWKGFKLPVVQDFMTHKHPPKVPVPSVCIQNDSIVSVEHLSVRFPATRDWKGSVKSWFYAVNDVSFHLKEQETLALVGESGSGKSTIGKALMGLVPLCRGRAYFKNQLLFDQSAAKPYHPAYGMQMVFQDAFAALNPRMSVGEMLQEPLMIHQQLKKSIVKQKVLQLLDITGMPAKSIQKYPHEFSGGQRQRLGIARSLAMNPKVLICDESVSALDVSVQAQILNLLNDLKSELQLSYLFITHDLQVVRYFCDRVMVLHKGAIVEEGEGDEWYNNPQHEYTRQLLNAH